MPATRQQDSLARRTLWLAASFVTLAPVAQGQTVVDLWTSGQGGCEVVELADPPGRLMLNMRNYDPDHRARQTALSDDGGERVTVRVSLDDLMGAE